MKKNVTPLTVHTPADPAAIEALSASANELVLLKAEASASALALAEQLGYDGSLELVALEDGIRHAQVRAVHAFIDVGTRLLLLKEVSPHGSFEGKLIELGFSLRSASRLMQAAAKVAKSAKLADLSSKAKNVSAFLEFVTEDDELLENLSQLDDIDKMSASQLRAAIRELKADHEAADQVLADKNAKLTRLEQQLKKKRVAATDFPAEFEGYRDQVNAASRDLVKNLAALELVRLEALQTDPDVPEGAEPPPALELAFKNLGNTMRAALTEAKRRLDDFEQVFDQTLGAFAD